MDGRESTVASGPNFSSFYAQHRGIGAPGVPGHSPGLHGPPPGGYRQHLDAVSAGYAFHNPHVGGPHIGQGYHHVEASPPVVQHSAGGGTSSGGAMDIGMGVAVGADAQGDQGSGAGGGQDEQVKKKRGRPKKYRSDGVVTLGLSSISSSMLHSLNSGWEPWSVYQVQHLGPFREMRERTTTWLWEDATVGVDLRSHAFLGHAWC